MNAKVDLFIKTQKLWPAEIVKLRAVLLSSGLKEDFKWRLPCYCYGDSNIAIIQPFKTCLGLMFFKGKLLKDKKGVLAENGPNSQASRRFEFHSVKEIIALTATVKAYVKEAIELEKAEAKIKFKKKPEAMPPELKKFLSSNPKLKAAFKALTPGRQRAYILLFSSAKQSATRIARIEKCIPKILAGKGLGDR